MVIAYRSWPPVVSMGGLVATEQKVGFSYVLAGPEIRQLRPEELTQSLQRKSRQQCAKSSHALRQVGRTGCNRWAQNIPRQVRLRIAHIADEQYVREDLGGD
jgi:hypothetical protein